MTQNQFQFTRKQFNCFKNHKYLLNMWINMSSYCSFWVFLLRVWIDILRLPRVVRMNSPNICVLNMRHVNGTNSWITKSRKVDSSGFIVTQEGHLSSFLYFSWNSVSFKVDYCHDWTSGRSGEPCLVLIWEWTIEIFQVQEIINVNILNNYK